ncbi:MAG: ribonuclease H-like domain-containing protein [Pseudomonadota bacterium]
MSEKKVLVFDLETIPDPTAMSCLQEIKPKANLKDPAKIAEDIAEKKQAQILSMGLDPACNMICCFGYCDANGPGSIMLTDATHEAEKDLLLKAWDLMSKYDVFVGFNSRAFDVRCLLLHGMLRGVRPSVNLDKGKYNRTGTNHVDLRQTLAGQDQFARGNLEFFSGRFLGEHKTEGIDGAMVSSFWDMGLYEDIAQYCEQDCVLTYRLYQMADAAGLLE